MRQEGRNAGRSKLEKEAVVDRVRVGLGWEELEGVGRGSVGRVGRDECGGRGTWGGAREDKGE